MGKIKHLENVMDFFKKTPVATTRDIKMIVGNSQYANLLLFNLMKSEKIKQLSRGLYTIYDDPVLAVFCFKPSYIGLQDALSFHDLWEQETNIVIITTKKIRTGTRRILNSNIVFHRINKKYFFGYEFVKYGNFYVPVSDKEKTLIDMIYFKEIPDIDVLKNISGVLDTEKIKKYLKRYPDRFRNKVFGIVRK